MRTLTRHQPENNSEEAQRVRMLKRIVTDNEDARKLWMKLRGLSESNKYNIIECIFVMIPAQFSNPENYPKKDGLPYGKRNKSQDSAWTAEWNACLYKSCNNGTRDRVRGNVANAARSAVWKIAPDAAEVVLVDVALVAGHLVAEDAYFRAIPNYLRYVQEYWKVWKSNIKTQAGLMELKRTDKSVEGVPSALDK